jgi:hypothetical protein
MTRMTRIKGEEDERRKWIEVKGNNGSRNLPSVTQQINLSTIQQFN